VRGGEDQDIIPRVSGGGKLTLKQRGGWGGGGVIKDLPRVRRPREARAVKGEGSDKGERGESQRRELRGSSGGKGGNGANWLFVFCDFIALR